MGFVALFVTRIAEVGNDRELSTLGRPVFPSSSDLVRSPVVSAGQLPSEMVERSAGVKGKVSDQERPVERKFRRIAPTR
jgi:hypothetical protein